MSNKVVEDYKLGAEPKNFQVETSGPNIYVNVPDLGEISVINRNTKVIGHWKFNGIANNFPMAMDEPDHRIFIGTHDPARMAVFDSTSGKMAAVLPGVIDTDDIFFDADLRRIYMPGGAGYIYVYQMKDPDHYELLAKIPTTVGAKRRGIGDGRARASIASTWLFQHAETRARKSESTPWRNKSCRLNWLRCYRINVLQ